MLQMFLKDPVLSKLNQRPTPDGARSVAATPKLLNQTALPENNSDATYRVNMWNPIVSTPKPRQSKGHANPELRTLMLQKPFRKNAYESSWDSSPFGKTVQIVHDLHERDQYKGKVMDKKDFIHPVKKIKLSITRLDNAVSFCRAQVQTKVQFNARKSNSAKTSICSSDRLPKSEHRSEHSAGNNVEINLVKGNIYEIPHKRYSADRCQDVELNHDKGIELETSDGTGLFPELKEVITDLKKDSSHDTKCDEFKFVSLEHEQREMSFDNSVSNHLSKGKVLECPAIVEAVFNSVEMNHLRSKTFEYPTAKDRFGNAVEAKFNDTERKHFKGKVVEKSHVKENGDQKKDKLIKCMEQSENKPGISLPKPTFGIPSPMTGNLYEKDKQEIKGISAKNSELLCSPLPLQSKKSDIQNWRLNNIKNQKEEKDEGSAKKEIDQDITKSVLKGNKISVENEKTKGQVQGLVELEVQSPRSSKRSQSGKGSKKRVKKTALASGVMTLVALQIDVLSFPTNRNNIYSYNIEFFKLFVPNLFVFNKHHFMLYRWLH